MDLCIDRSVCSTLSLQAEGERADAVGLQPRPAEEEVGVCVVSGPDHARSHSEFLRRKELEDDGRESPGPQTPTPTRTSSGRRITRTSCRGVTWGPRGMVPSLSTRPRLADVPNCARAVRRRVGSAEGGVRHPDFGFPDLDSGRTWATTSRGRWRTCVGSRG